MKRHPLNYLKFLSAFDLMIVTFHLLQRYSIRIKQVKNYKFALYL